jgi:two-component system NtrC family sensor kinase
MAVKLQHTEQTHGVLTVLSCDSFSDRNRLVFEAIARQTTLALRNAILYAMTVDYAEHLEDKVEERTQELRSAQDLLVRSEKLASVGRLAAGLAHEINNPLMPIRMNLEMMQEDIQSGIAVSERDIEETLRSVTRIGRIVERLQQFTRHGNEMTPEMEPLPVSAVMENVLALSETYMRHNKVNLDVQIDNQAYVYGNRDQLEQVFLNIILNAQAAMDEGGSLQIRAIPRENDVQISFKDTGHGIPQDMLDKIFEPFISTKESGSGLGLFISHNVIHNHSGDIHVESVVGKGTTFTLTLPTIIQNGEES